MSQKKCHTKGPCLGCLESYESTKDVTGFFCSKCTDILMKSFDKKKGVSNAVSTRQK